MKKFVFLLAVALLFQATFVRAQDEEPEDEGEEKEEEEFVRLRRSPGGEYSRNKGGKEGDEYGMEGGKEDRGKVKEYKREKGKKFFLHAKEKIEAEAALKKSKKTPKEKKLLLKKAEKKKYAEQLKLKTPKKKVDEEKYAKLKKFKSLYVEEKKGRKGREKGYEVSKGEGKGKKKNERKKPEKRNKIYEKNDGY